MTDSSPVVIALSWPVETSREHWAQPEVVAMHSQTSQKNLSEPEVVG